MLNGCRVLIVEDEAVVAEDLKHILTDAEAVVIGPFASVSEARKLLKGGTPVDAALLDLNLSDGPVTPLLETLHASGVPTVIYSGGRVAEHVRRRHPDLVALSKPVVPARLLAELRRVRARRML